MRNRLYITSAVLAMVLSLVPVARDIHAADEFYTIQTGTFSLNAFEFARRQALLLYQKLAKEDRSDIRIEEGSRYYIVRLGKYRDAGSAEKVFIRVKPLAEDAFILKDTGLEKTRVLKMKGNDEKPLSVPDEFYSLQTGKFQRYEQAREKFETLVQKWSPRDRDHLRIIQSGDYYRIRIGMFSTSAAAEEYQRKIREELPVTSMVRVDAQEEKTVDRRSPVQTKPPDSEIPPKTDSDSTARQQAAQAPANSDKEKQVLDKIFNDVSAFYSKQEYGKAAEIIRKGLARWPDNPDLHAWYGAALLATGFPDKAYEAYRKAAALQPDVPDYHSGAGHSLLDTHIDRARNSAEAFRKALTIDPNNASALEGLGILYVSTGRKFMASEVYERLKQLDQAAADRLNQFILYGLDWGDSR